MPNDNMEEAGNDVPLKLKTARTLKWNTFDRIASQVLYAVVGVVLANRLSPEDFGLVGALLVFQAFATILTDGGFGMALLQKKEVSHTDYSTVFWFNLIFSLILYGILYAAAPLIARIFQNDSRLIPLSRGMFTAFVLNGFSIVQTTRLMKKMSVKQVAIADIVGLTIGGAVGILLAFCGYGPWSLVWQTVTSAGVKSAWLWLSTRWIPSLEFSFKSMKSVLPVGTSVLATQTLSTICLYAYQVVVGAFYSLRALGLYTQADKWSKMGSTSMVQVLTSTFVPLLSGFADDASTHQRYICRINRFTAFIVLPVLCGLALVGEPLFHTIFIGNKWDVAIPLFQILTIRGIFVVLIQLYYNYAVSLGHSRAMLAIETAKDVTIFVAILATVFSRSLEALVWGQAAASVVTFFISLGIASKVTGYGAVRMLIDMLPFAAFTAVACAVAWIAGLPIGTAWVRLMVEIATGLVSYLLLLRIFRTPELPEMAGYLLGRFRRKPSVP